MKSEQEELQLLLRSRFPIIVVETPEEARFLALIETVANLDESPLFTWTTVQGLRRPLKRENVPQTRELIEAVQELVKEEFENYNDQMGLTGLRGDQVAYEMLVQHLVGLSRDDARRMVRQAIEHEGAITLEGRACCARSTSPWARAAPCRW